MYNNYFYKQIEIRVYYAWHIVLEYPADIQHTCMIIHFNWICFFLKGH